VVRKSHLPLKPSRRRERPAITPSARPMTDGDLGDHYPPLGTRDTRTIPGAGIGVVCMRRALGPALLRCAAGSGTGSPRCAGVSPVQSRRAPPAAPATRWHRPAARTGRGDRRGSRPCGAGHGACDRLTDAASRRNQDWRGPESEARCGHHAPGSPRRAAAVRACSGQLFRTRRWRVAYGTLDLLGSVIGDSDGDRANAVR
jgi:hypothetical protein